MMSRTRITLADFELLIADRQERCQLCPLLIPWTALAFHHPGRDFWTHAACLLALKRANGMVWISLGNRSDVVELDNDGIDPLTPDQRETLELMQS
jgi:hypothetical protein